MILLIVLLIKNSASFAITISAASTDLGFLISGKSLTLSITASDYEGSSQKITWTTKLEGGKNPGLKLSKKNGDSVTLSTKKLTSPGKNDGSFIMTVTAKDANKETASITFSGTVLDPPVIKTKTLPKTSAGVGKSYKAKIELSSGSEPLEWSFNLDEGLPAGLELEKESNSSRTYYTLSGYAEEPGYFPITLTVENTILGISDTKDYTLQVAAVKPTIKKPKSFPKKFDVIEGEEFTIDINALEYKGTPPFQIDIDEYSKQIGITYNRNTGIISGILDNERLINGPQHVIRLQVRNPYTPEDAPVTLNLNVSMKTLPRVPKVTLSNFIWRDGDNKEHDGITFEGDYYNPFYVEGNSKIGKPFKAKFTAQSGTPPIKWDFINEDTGNNLIEDYGGNFHGLKFSSNGTITGSIEYTYGYQPLNIGVFASNAAGYNYLGELHINFGYEPEFNKELTSTPIVLKNFTSVDIYLPDFMEEWANTFTTKSILPAGLTLSNDGTISGFLEIENAKDLKKYNIDLVAKNDFGSTKGKIIFDVKEAPKYVFMDYKTSATFTASNFYDEDKIKLNPKKMKIFLDSVEDSKDITSESNWTPAVIGKDFQAKFSVGNGSKPLAWDFIIASMDNNLNGKSIIKDLGGEFEGLTFKSDGTIKGKPTNESGDYSQIVFHAFASNDVGHAYSYRAIWINFGHAPALDTSKTAKPIVLANGESVDVNIWDACINYPAMQVFSKLIQYEIQYSKYWTEQDVGKNHIHYILPHFSTSNKLPAGLEFSGLFRDEDEEEPRITGKLNIKNPNDFKKYTINLSAFSDYGTAKGKIILDVQPIPKINALTTNLLSATLGNPFKLKIPAETEKTCKWILKHNGQTVTSTIGNSGLAWNASKGLITAQNVKNMKVGSYDVTVYLSNDVGFDSKDLTLFVTPKPLEITAPKILNAAKIGKPYSVQAKAKGSEPFTWGLRNAPADFVIDKTTGKITATMSDENVSASDIGVNNFVIVVSDDYGQSATLSVRLIITGTKTAQNNNSSPENYVCNSEVENEKEITSPENSHTLYIFSENDLARLNVHRVLPDGFITAAVLPVVSVDENGMYDFEVELSQDIYAGKKLFWFANSEEPCEDDDIAEFFNADGEEISCVPDDKKFSVSAWLNKEKVYAPVIAIRQ